MNVITYESEGTLGQQHRYSIITNSIGTASSLLIILRLRLRWSSIHLPTAELAASVGWTDASAESP